MARACRGNHARREAGGHVAVVLRAGATIRELNAVRKHLSDIKGGQLGRWAAPARVISLIMSDVIGDPLDFIASGPTAPDTTSFSDALAIIQKYAVAVPAAVIERLQAGARGQIPDTPKAGRSAFSKRGQPDHRQQPAARGCRREKAAALGFKTLILGTEVEGEAKDVAGSSRPLRGRSGVAEIRFRARVRPGGR